MVAPPAGHVPGRVQRAEEVLPRDELHDVRDPHNWYRRVERHDLRRLVAVLWLAQDVQSPAPRTPSPAFNDRASLMHARRHRVSVEVPDLLRPSGPSARKDAFRPRPPTRLRTVTAEHARPVPRDVERHHSTAALDPHGFGRSIVIVSALLGGLALWLHDRRTVASPVGRPNVGTLGAGRERRGRWQLRVAWAAS